MDFHSIINTAQQNISSSNGKGKFYKAGFEPPKKMTKERKLTAGIQKFLEQRKREEEEQAKQARQKKLEMISKRDPKEQRKIEKSLKVIKSSKKFHGGELIPEETVTNEQPDEDDYGYTSNISDQYHKKLMEKYQSLPEEKKFSSGSGKHKAMSKEEMQRTKDRVKSAFTTPDEEQSSHIRTGPQHRTSKVKCEKDTRHGAGAPPDKKFEKPKPKLKAAPIIDYQQILKLAEQKQHEDITIEVPTKKEPERLLTQKEKREQEELEASRRAKLKPNRIPKLGAIPKVGESSKQDKNNNDSLSKKPSAPQSTQSAKSNPLSTPRPQSTLKKPALPQPSTSAPKTSSKLRDALQQKQNGSSSKPQASSNNLKVPSSKPGSLSSSSLKAPKSTANGQRPSTSSANNNLRPSNSSKAPDKTRDFPPKDLLRTREFPPKDVMRGREFPPRDTKRLTQQQISRKRRVIEDEESDYDSEMDDFIDDGDDDGDYSSEIKKIFGYDKSRYQDEDFDDRLMESDFKTVMREEIVSKRLGIQEDLEDMRMEEEEKKRKAMRKKRKL